MPIAVAGEMALRVIGVGLGAEAVAPSGWELKADRPVGGLGDADVGCGTGTLGEVPAASTIDPFSACSRAACMHPKQRYQDQGANQSMSKMGAAKCSRYKLPTA